MKRRERILKLIEQNWTANEIMKILNINDEKLKEEICTLQKEGHNITKQFFYNGKQKYVLQKSVPDNITHILASPKNGEFHAIAASDYHLGNKRQNIDYIKIIYEFAAKNDIHIIFNCGDIIEGMVNKNYYNQDYYEQIENLLTNHPFDENILSFVVLGNHDADLLRNTGLDLNTIINENRSDLISLGYNPATIGIHNNEILMCHAANEIRNRDAKLKLTGHGHRYHFGIHNCEPSIYLPTASDNIYDDYPPGFVHLNFELNNGLFTKGTFHFYTFNRKHEIKTCYDKYNYETSYPKQKTLRKEK